MSLPLSRGGGWSGSIRFLFVPSYARSHFHIDSWGLHNVRHSWQPSTFCLLAVSRFVCLVCHVVCMYTYRERGPLPGSCSAFSFFISPSIRTKRSGDLPIVYYSNYGNTKYGIGGRWKWAILLKWPKRLVVNGSIVRDNTMNKTLLIDIYEMKSMESLEWDPRFCVNPYHWLQCFRTCILGKRSPSASQSRRGDFEAVILYSQHR